MGKMTGKIPLLFALILLPEAIRCQNRELVPTEAPTNLTLLEIRNRQVTIEWDAVSPDSIRGKFRGYVVRTWSHSGSQVYIFPADVTRASVEFFPYSKNFITVSTRNEKYVGPPSEAISFDAPQLEPSPPKSLDVFPLSARSVLLTWTRPSHPNGILLGYKVHCTVLNTSSPIPEPTDRQVSHEIYDPNKLQAKLTGMEEGVRYEIAISAINCAGESGKKATEILPKSHVSMQPTSPKFHYKIGYKTLDRAAVCANFLNVPGGENDPKEGDFEDFRNQSDSRNEIVNGTRQHCFVDFLIVWIPDVRNNPGEHFYVKYRTRGEKSEFLETSPELSEDFTILNDFDACKNHEIVLVAVDGEFKTESDLLVTPTTIF